MATPSDSRLGGHGLDPAVSKLGQVVSLYIASVHLGLSYIFMNVYLSIDSASGGYLCTNGIAGCFPEVEMVLHWH